MKVMDPMKVFLVYDLPETIWEYLEPDSFGTIVSPEMLIPIVSCAYDHPFLSKMIMNILNGEGEEEFAIVTSRSTCTARFVFETLLEIG